MVQKTTNVAMRAGISVSACIISMVALAGDPNLDRMAPPPPAVPSIGGPSGPPSLSRLQGSGVTRSSTWISAVKFTGRDASTDPPLSYDSYYYFAPAGVAGTRRYYAQLDLDPGVAVDALTCIVDDSSSVNNFSARLQKYTTDFSTDSRLGSNLASNSTTGDSGIQYLLVELPAPETISTYDGWLVLTQYHLAVDVASDTPFAGCWAWWTRQISPAPAVSSFTDVSTGHWAFQHIEALKASGVTTGCGGSAYCPDDYVTRAQMAAFLARALGLSWPDK